MCVLPGVDPVGGSRSPEQFAQVLPDTLPQDVAGALALFTAAHHKLVEVGSAAVHRLHGDDGCRTVAGATEARETLRRKLTRLWNFKHSEMFAQTFQKGRWNAVVPSGRQRSPASEFYQTTC